MKPPTPERSVCQTSDRAPRERTVSPKISISLKRLPFLFDSPARLDVRRSVCVCCCHAFTNLFDFHAVPNSVSSSLASIARQSHPRSRDLGEKPVCVKSHKGSFFRAHLNEHIAQLGSSVPSAEWLRHSRSRICPKCP